MAHARATLIALHILTVVILSLPSSRQMLQRKVWELPSNQRAFAVMADRLSWLGFDSTEELEQWLWGVAERYVRVRDTVVKPLVLYADLAGARQGWGMFSRPRVEPVELQIDVGERHRFELVYQTGSREHDFLSWQLRQYRMRKVTGRLARHFDSSWYDPLARRIATEAAVHHLEADRVRVRLYQYTTLPPEDVRAGVVPEGEYRERRLFNAESLR